MTTRVLIVDDETGSRFMARLFLEEAGFAPDEAVSGVDALERCGTVDYDVVVLDQRMPGLSGMDVARELTESDYPGRLLLFTAYQAPELEAEATRLSVPVVGKARKETLVEHVRELAELSAA
jgi:two-component system, LytTR family, response regulator AlgR